MSLYRSLLAAVAAIAIAMPVFAEETPATTQTSTDTTATQQVTGENGTTTTTEQSTTTEQIKVNLNKATVKELMKVKGINASKARSIVAYRKKHGDFKSTDDLTNVKGFKKMKSEPMKDITDQLTVE